MLIGVFTTETLCKLRLFALPRVIAAYPHVTTCEQCDGFS
jgi:hypothetical protein